MSCYKIEYNQTGAKILVPVTSKEEYLRLRGSQSQVDRVNGIRKCPPTPQGRAKVAKLKRKLLQFNYSCIPGEDGLLKGCKTPSTSFGMDIDFNEDENESEKQTHAILNRIIEHKEEVGLLMLERSVRHGYHLVMKRNPELSQVENLKRASEILEVEFDAGAKDITRVFYATTDSSQDLLLLSDELFINQELENSRINKSNSMPGGENNSKNSQEFKEKHQEKENIELSPSLNVHTGKADNESSVDESATNFSNYFPSDQWIEFSNSLILDKKSPSAYAISCFDLCREEAGLSLADLDKEGCRHNNLKAILSVGLCQLMSQEELLAVVKQKMPNYWNDANDAQVLVKNFYENYCDPNGKMSLTLRKIYARSQAETRPSPKGTESMDLVGYDSPLLEGEGQGVRLLPPLPRLLQLLVKAYPEEYRPAVIMSSLVFLGTLLSKLRAHYIDGEAHSPSFICCITAPQASGKSFTRRLYTLLTEPIKLQDQIGRKLEREYNEKKRSAKNSKQQPEDPKALIRLIPATASNAMILKRADYANGLHLCTYAEEIDTLTKGQKAGAWSEKSDLYRMAFDNAEWGQDYMSDNSYSGQVQLFYNLLVCGTPNAMNRFFKDVEDGLVSRVMFVQLPDMLGAKMPRFGAYTGPDLKEIRATVRKLWEVGSGDLTPCPSLQGKGVDTTKLEGKDTEDISLPVLTGRGEGEGLQGEGVIWIDEPGLVDAIDNWLEEKRLEYLQNQDNPALEIFRRRAGVCGFRAGMVAYALNGFEWSKDCEEFALWVAEFTLQNQLTLFGEKMNTVMANQENETQTLAATKKRNGRNVQILNELPKVFTLQDLTTVRLAYGYTSIPYYILNRWEKNDLVEKVDKNHWKKI